MCFKAEPGQTIWLISDYDPKRNWESKKPRTVAGLVAYLRSSLVFDFPACGSPLGLWSPSVDFAGQTPNTGHFLQPTAIATGHSVMETPWTVCPIF
jgi:hypothetical protein